jgi:PadR family transcriptional regulator, regulatory protein PadR
LRSYYFFTIAEFMAGQSYSGEFELMIRLALIHLGEDAYGVPISRELRAPTAAATLP